MLDEHRSVVKKAPKRYASLERVMVHIMTNAPSGLLALRPELRSVLGLGGAVVGVSESRSLS